MTTFLTGLWVLTCPETNKLLLVMVYAAVILRGSSAQRQYNLCGGFSLASSRPVIAAHRRCPTIMQSFGFLVMLGDHAADCGHSSAVPATSHTFSVLARLFPTTVFNCVVQAQLAYDLRQALLYSSHRYPQAPLLGLGFSLGANVLTRYVAEEGRRDLNEKSYDLFYESSQYRVLHYQISQESARLLVLKEQFGTPGREDLVAARSLTFNTLTFSVYPKRNQSEAV
ncbi:hypothetical protein BJV74DRAFT_794787 [Russula compacta]|nr:hypothetical protein BJV74DRAFT_794787 [Russula compacta]